MSDLKECDVMAGLRVMEGDRFILRTDRLLSFLGAVMAERYSIVGVYPDGRRTTLLVNAAKDDATLIAAELEQGCAELIRIDVIAEMPEWAKGQWISAGS